MKNPVTWLLYILYILEALVFIQIPCDNNFPFLYKQNKINFLPLRFQSSKVNSLSVSSIP